LVTEVKSKRLADELQSKFGAKWRCNPLHPVSPKAT
jgi:hypothetical protein